MMMIAQTLAMVALVAPLTAAAQVSYSQAAVGGQAPYYYRESNECDARNDALWDRKARMDERQRLVDREGLRLDRMKARLDDEYRRLDWSDDRAIRDYNARSGEYNRLIAEHNRRISRINGEASVLNGDSEELVARCGGNVVTTR